MKSIRFACTILLTILSWPRYVGACDLTPDKIEEIMGVKATVAADGVVRVSWPRKDVKVRVDGVAMRPFAGLGSWAAFQKMDEGAMVMGNTVVFEDEVNPALDAALAAGLEVTALHNHFFFDESKVYFMHIGGSGCPDKLARGVRAVWDAVKQVRAAAPVPAKNFPGEVPAIAKFDTDRVAEIVGRQRHLGRRRVQDHHRSRKHDARRKIQRQHGTDHMGRIGRQRGEGGDRWRLRHDGD